jgi:GNAT superfamily N-acetyltransferase
MELIRRTVPYDATAALKLLEDTFGYEEVVVEGPQLLGKEVAVNTDLVWEAWEDEKLLGTIHATIPKSFPTICGLSAMATHPSARGKGLGRILFAKIIEEYESQGVTAAFLGTSNPIAAKLYHSLGFSFLPGSHVMVRYAKGDTVDFVREYYAPVRESCRILKDDSAIRIPLIPWRSARMRITFCPES